MASCANRPSARWLRQVSHLELVSSACAKTSLRCSAASDVVVHSSLREGLPRVVLEALSVGTPLVATAVGGVAEVVKDGENGLLVPPSNPEALARRDRGHARRSERRGAAVGTGPAWRSTLLGSAGGSTSSTRSICASSRAAASRSPWVGASGGVTCARQRVHRRSRGLVPGSRDRHRRVGPFRAARRNAGLAILLDLLEKRECARPSSSSATRRSALPR